MLGGLVKLKWWAHIFSIEVVENEKSQQNMYIIVYSSQELTLHVLFVVLFVLKIVSDLF